MLIKTAKYIASFPDVKKCPADHLPEFAFIGRSNVGKSSLINSLTGYTKLAKISVTPGKTQLLNFFLINNLWYLVDLPGYGYAKVSKDKRAGFDKMIRNYLTDREGLINVFQLIDGTLPPQPIDIEFSNWLGENNIPFSLVFTKSDKKKKADKDAATSYCTALAQHWDELPKHIITSSVTHLGKEQLLDCIGQLIKQSKPTAP